MSGPLAYLWWLTSSQWPRVLLGAFWGTVYMVSLMVPPYLMSRAIDDGLVARDLPVLVGWSATLFAMGLFTSYCGIMRHRTMTKVRMDASFRTIRVVVRHCAALGNTLRGKVTSGEVVTVGATDVTQIAQALTVTGPGVGAAIAYIVLAVILFQVSWLLAVIVGVGVPALAVLMLPLLRRLGDAEAVYRERQGSLTGLSGDIVSGLRVLAGTGGGAIFARRYHAGSASLRAEGYRVGVVSSWIHALGTGVPALYLAGVVWLTARMAATGQISVGDLVSVYGYIAALTIPVAFFLEAGYDITRAIVAGRRVIAVLSLPQALTDDGTTEPEPETDLHDPASGVTVRHGELTVLAADRDSDVDALMDRLGRLTDSDATWGSVPLQDIPLSTVRASILVADNDGHIFPGTIGDALAAPGREAAPDAQRTAFDRERITAALETAVATDIVDALPLGLDSPLPDRATTLSGGQRQRLRLARALLVDAEMLLLNDPTSAVDARTEADIAARLRLHRAGRTTLVVSTSPLWLDRADRVAYLRADRLAATGVHRDLLVDDRDYRALVTRDIDPDPAPEPKPDAEPPVSGEGSDR
ncbi:ABC transporter [Stackebrandtia soli]